MSFLPDTTVPADAPVGTEASAVILKPGNETSLGNVTFNSMGRVTNNALVPLILAYQPTDGASQQSIIVDPSNLQIRTDVHYTQVGFLGLLSADVGDLPQGINGVVYAGSYTLPISFNDSLGSEHTGSLVFQPDLDEQVTGTPSGKPAVWRALFTYDDPTIVDDTEDSGAGTGPIPIDAGYVSLSQSGTLAANSLNTITVKYTNGAKPSHLVFDPTGW